MRTIFYFLVIISSSLLRIALSQELLSCSDSMANEDLNQEITDLPDVNVTFNRNDLVLNGKYRTSDAVAVDVSLDNVVVSFVKENQIINFSSLVIGSARVMGIGYDSQKLKYCDLSLIKNLNEAYDVEQEFLDAVSSCVDSKLCKKLDVVTMDDFKNGSIIPSVFEQLTDQSVTDNISENDIPPYEFPASQNDSRVEETQETLNAFIDLMVTKVSANLKENAKGKFSMANMNTTFPFPINAEFLAENGNLEDMSLVERVDNIYLSHDGMNFKASGSFRLAETNVHYDKYKINHFFFGEMANGELNATVNNITLAVEVTADYDQKPCKVQLQNLQVTELGIIDIALSGLGALDNLFSSIASFGTIFFEKEITHTLETEVKEFIDNKLKEYNCDISV